MLDLENPDLFKWLTGQEEPPAELEQNMAFQVADLLDDSILSRTQRVSMSPMQLCSLLRRL